MSDNPYESPLEPPATNVEDEPPARPSHWCATTSLLFALLGAILVGYAESMVRDWAPPQPTPNERHFLMFLALGVPSCVVGLGLGEHVFRAQLPGKGLAFVAIVLSLVPLIILFGMCYLPLVQ